MEKIIVDMEQCSEIKEMEDIDQTRDKNSLLWYQSKAVFL